MEVTHKINDNLTAEIAISFVEDDYAEDVKKTLNEYRRKANIRGFRPGKVPFGMIKNMYGEAVMADTISKKLGEALDKYLLENKFETLGQPLPDDEKQKTINFKTDKEFSFHYVVGLKPEFDVDINDKLKLDYYNIDIADDAVDKYLMDIRKRFGTHSNPDTVSEGDILTGTMVEVDADGNKVENGIDKKATINLDIIKLKGVKSKFLKLKKGDSIIFNPARAFKNDIDVASILGIGLNEAKKFKSDVKFTVEEISHVEPAELNEELFSKVYENDFIDSEEALRKRILRDIEETYKNEGKNQFMNDMVDLLIEKTNLDLPDEFMKRWIIENNQKEDEDKRISPEELEYQYQNYRDTLRWQIIEEKLAKKYGLTITNDEIKKRIGEILGLQVMGNDDDEKGKEIIEQVTESVMQNREEVNKIADQIMEQKLIDLFKEKATIKEKNISYDNFVKMVSEKVAKKAEKK